MQVTLFVWLNAKIEKISTKDKFENYGFFFAQYYRSIYTSNAMNYSKDIIYTMSIEYGRFEPLSCQRYRACSRTC